MKAISNVTVNEEKAEHKVSNVTDGVLTIPAAAMKKDAENLVVISANGYKNLVIKVAVDANGQPTLKPSEPTEPGTPDTPDTSLAAPVVKIITEDGIGPGKHHKLAFEQYENITAYLNAVTRITIDGTELTKTATLWNSRNSYALSVVNSSQSVYAYDSIDFSEDCFGKGEVTVTITAKGYEDLTFRVTDGTLAPTEPSESKAPAVAKIALENSILSGKYYVLSFEGAEKEAAAFIDAISKITAGDREIQRVNTFFHDTMSYKPGNDPVNGGAYQYLHFTEDCFAGEKTIVISAEGYEDLTFQVKNGALVH